MPITDSGPAPPRVEAAPWEGWIVICSYFVELSPLLDFPPAWPVSVWEVSKLEAPGAYLLGYLPVALS